MSSRRRPGTVLAVADEDDRVLQLSDAGDDRSAWVTLLTTEHYALQGMRSATIGEANGRASIFLGAVSAGLIALGFQGGGRSPATTAFGSPGPHRRSRSRRLPPGPGRAAGGRQRPSARSSPP